jgi:RNA polymerase sigma-70 factor (ECF subfamily)
MSGPPAVDRKLAARCHAAARAADWQLSIERFQTALTASLARGCAGRTLSPSEIARHVEALHLEDLALACACADGYEPAWDHFVREYRPTLTRAASAIDRTGGGKDLADSLLADLFGLRTRDGVRQSLFQYFHGRSSLATWLRAVLAQRHVDGIRATRRLDPLPEDESGLPRAEAADVDPDQARHAATLQSALGAAIAALAPRDRLRLSCYYVQHLKLAAIGRAMGEHEATVSRHLARTRQDIRAAVEQRLRIDHRLDDRGIAECFEAAASDAGSLDLAQLVGAAADGKNAGAARSKE